MIVGIIGVVVGTASGRSDASSGCSPSTVSLRLRLPPERSGCCLADSNPGAI